MSEPELKIVNDYGQNQKAATSLALSPTLQPHTFRPWNNERNSGSLRRNIKFLNLGSSDIRKQPTFQKEAEYLLPFLIYKTFINTSQMKFALFAITSLYWLVFWKCTTLLFFWSTGASHIFPSLYWKSWFLNRLLSNTNLKVLEILKPVLPLFPL